MLIGCSVAPLNKSVVRQEPYKNAAGKSLSISVNKVVNAIDSKKVVGKFYAGTACVDHGDLRYRGSDRFINEMTNYVRSKLEEYGYSVIGKAHSPFNEEFSGQSNFILGGKVIDVQANICYSVNGAKGEAYTKVEWQIYDNKKKSIILTLTTEGYAALKDFDSTGDAMLFDPAFQMAVDNLLASKAFYGLLIK
jgi:hypothetical protein